MPSKSRKASAASKQAASASRAEAAVAASPEDKVIDAALALIADRGWAGISLAEIAERAGLSLGQLYALFPSKDAILAAFFRSVDRATLAGADVSRDDTTSIRDRLFDLFMRRFDALAPHKKAVAALVADLPRRPTGALCQAGRTLRSIAWMASAAGVDTQGIMGMLRVNALTAVHLYVLRVWLGDDGADQAKTMAALDKALKQVEMVAQSFPFRAGKRAAAAD